MKDMFYYRICLNLEWLYTQIALNRTTFAVKLVRQCIAECFNFTKSCKYLSVLNSNKA